MTRPCLACRSRKMRCDGVTPQCGPCSRARKSLECTYGDKSLTQRNATLLPKGAACLPCRRKKKKCNAERPFCNTCHFAGKEWECEYDDEIQQNIATDIAPPTRELEQPLTLYGAQQQYISQPLALQPTPMTDFDVSSFQRNTLSPSPLVPLHPQNASAYSFMPWSTTPSAPSHNLSLWTSHIFQPKTTNTTHSSPCRDSHELRMLFLAHQIQLGFYLCSTKWHAVRVGDFSGQVIHPAVVYLAQVVGCFLWKLHYKTRVLVVSEELELRNVLDSLEAIPPDPPTQVMVYTVLGEYLLFKRQLDLGREYLARASRVLSVQDLHSAAPDMDDSLSFDEPAEDTKEYLSALGQLLYVDQATSMVLRLPRFLGFEYDRQLRSLTIMHPWLAQHSAIIMRCKSVWLLLEAMQLSQIRAATTSGSSSARLETALPTEWATRYWTTLEDAVQHVALLYPRMLQASLDSDPQHTLCLKVCIIVTLTAQLELHRMPGSYHVESRRKAMCVIVEVVRLLRGLKSEDYTMLEPTLGICFTIIADTLREDQGLQMELPSNSASPQDTLEILISVATQLSLTIPYVEPALQTLHDLAVVV